MSKNIVVVMQHVNWEDSGGDHDPALVTVDDKLFEELVNYTSTHQDECPEQLRDALSLVIRDTQPPALPCTLDAVFNIWYDY